MAQLYRQRMHLVFAVAMDAGKMPGDFVSSEASENSAERNSNATRRSRGSEGILLRMQQREERYESRDPWPSRKERKMEKKRDNDRYRKRDRKDDHRRDWK